MIPAVELLQVGDIVEWTTTVRGRELTRTGKIVKVIPPDEPCYMGGLLEEFPIGKYSYQRMLSAWQPTSRPTIAYLIAGAINTDGSIFLYFPKPELLRVIQINREFIYEAKPNE